MTDAVAVTVSRSSRVRRTKVPWIGSPWLWLGVILGGLMALWLARDLLTSYGPADVRPERLMLPVGSPGSPLIASVPVSLASGVLPATASMGLGTVLGLVSGYFGGWIDRLIMSIMDVLLAFPFILMAILAVAILGPSFWNAMIAVAIAILPRNARIIRAETLSLRERDFVTAARLSGASGPSIIVQHMLPNVLPTALVVGSTEIGQMIAATAGLSYLGLGVQQPDVDWGTLIAEGGRLIAVAPTLALMPSALVAIVSIAFVLAGDDLRHRLAGGEASRSERL